MSYVYMGAAEDLPKYLCIPVDRGAADNYLDSTYLKDVRLVFTGLYIGGASLPSCLPSSSMLPRRCSHDHNTFAQNTGNYRYPRAIPMNPDMRA